MTKTPAQIAAFAAAKAAYNRAYKASMSIAAKRQRTSTEMAEYFAARSAFAAARAKWDGCGYSGHPQIEAGA